MAIDLIRGLLGAGDPTPVEVGLDDAQLARLERLFAAVDRLRSAPASAG